MTRINRILRNPEIPAIGEVEVSAPLGLEDLFSAVVRPTDRFKSEKSHLFLDRMRSKAWREIWPELTFVTQQ
ncbi:MULTISPECIES: nucleotidyltransferase family protein [unclassified Pseudomonas]|uniref:nucleotidyltransferase family protein n=1 Tax=unclassified Pseudomonas TaxID=196821 RepID=UPI002893057B|nr:MULTISPECIES: nucleotidyltransferase family protein [unclassified Pseudomonas]